MTEGNNATVGGSNGAQATEPNNQSGQNTEQTGKGTEKTYTETELVSEVDRRVRQAQIKWAEELDEKLNSARSEGEKLAKMNAEERAKAEFEAEKKAFESDRAEYETERLEFEAVRQLSENKLPISFAKMCVGQDAEETKANIEAFKIAWSEAIQDAVNDRMKGTTPKAGTGEGVNTSTGFIDVINDLHR